MRTIDLQMAVKMIKGVERKATKIGVPMVTAVVDAGGNLVAQHRMDGALLASIDISLNKAYTAVATKMATSDLSAASQPGQPLFGIHGCDNGRIVIFGGGHPLLLNNEVVGGIGASGGSVEEDMACAQAGDAVFSAWAKKNLLQGKPE